jgi:branched-subunit amino acid aminotransferase/4-amino-4-deoxychorismate lyase
MERAFTIEKLLSCRRIFLLNAVRGMQQVKLIHPNESKGRK